MSIKFKEPFKKTFESSDQALLIFTFVLSLAVSIVVIYQREKALADLYESRFVHSASDLTRQLGLPLKINNIIGINDLLNRSFLTEESAFVQVLDVNNQLLYNSPLENVPLCQGTLKVGPVNFQNESVGTLRYCFSQPKVVSWQVLLVGLSGILIGWLLLFILIGMWYRRRTYAFEEFFKFVDRFDFTAEVIDLPEFHDSKIKIAANKIVELARRFEAKQEEVTKLERAQEYARLASQVSHDIRSPLSALNMILTQLGSISEDKRILIRTSVNRINDIANSLLTQGKQQRVGLQNEGPNSEEVLLASIVDALVSEKRVQFRQYQNIQIQAHLQDTYGLFVRLNPIEFKRVLSNLINNSVEAITNQSGNIEIFIRPAHDSIILTVNDNGRGIPKSVLDKLGTFGVSHGKIDSESGSGLGIYHAKNTIKSFGGSLTINSCEGHGTTVTIRLPQTEPPKWFVRKLSLQTGQNVIVLDDDSSILEIWKQRFGKLSAGNKVELVTFSNSSDLKKWIRENPDFSSTSTFLMDFELLGQSETGLDLIEHFDLAANAILVTSRFEEAHIKVRCQRLMVGLIPKAMAPLIPIEISSPKLFHEGLMASDTPKVEKNNSAYAIHNKVSPPEFAMTCV